MADPKDPNIERLARQKYINIFDLKRAQRKAINDRLSFKSVLTLGNLGSQSKAVNFPTLTPTPSPSGPTPTPSISPSPTPTPTPTFFKPNSICVDSSYLFPDLFSKQTFNLISNNAYEIVNDIKYEILFSNSGPWNYWYINLASVPNATTLAYASGIEQTLPNDNEWKIFPGGEAFEIAISTGPCPSPTPSPSPTASRGPTPTPTPSPSGPTPTPTNTPTATPTVTPTSIPPTPSLTPTSTPTRTPTPTPSPSSTPTPTPTSTPVPPTPTASSTPTSTPVPPTPTASSTPGPTPTPTSTAVSLNFLSALQITEFSTFASLSGGSIGVSLPYLSGTCTVPPSAFEELSLVQLSVPNSNNSYYFAQNSNTLQFLNYLSLTGSRDFGYYKLNLNEITGGTSYAGINAVSALNLNLSYFLPHLPFTIFNSAALTPQYRDSYLNAVSGNYKNFKIILEVSEFLKEVNGQNYQLKTFVLKQNSLSFIDSLTVYGAPRYYNTPDTFVELFPKDPEVQNTDISKNALLSGVLLTPNLRQLLTPYNSYYSVYDGLTSAEQFNLYISLSSVALSTFWGYASKPLFYTNPIKFNNKWGYFINSVAQYSNLSALQAQGYTFSPLVTSMSERLYFSVAYTGAQYYSLLSSFYFNPIGITLSDAYPLTSINLTVSGSRNLLEIDLPVDDKYEKTVVSFYAKQF